MRRVPRRGEPAHFRFAVVAVAVTLAGVATGLSGCGNGASPRAETPQDTVPAVASPEPNGTQLVTVSTSDTLRFVPSVLEARPGRIEIVVHNVGNTPHDLVFGPPLSVGTPIIDAGETRALLVTVTRPGTYPFSCSYHVSLGMTGRLVVRAGTVR